MNRGTGLAALRAGLDTLDAALDRDDLAAAGAAMSAHDLDLRGYLAECGRDAPVVGLRALLDEQHRILARMDTLRRGVAGELDRVRRASAASRAYAGAGVA